MASKRNRQGDWQRVCSGWYRITMGTEYWLPKPPTEMEAVYIAPNLFYKPDGCRDLSKNNSDAWCMLIIDGPEELLGQEITWFNRTNDSAEDVPLEVAEDIVQHYNLYGKKMDGADMSIFDINPGLISHPEFNGGIGSLGPSSPELAQALANAANGVGQGQGELAPAGHGFNQMPQMNMEQMQSHFDNQTFGNPQGQDMYDDRGWVTTGDSLNGGAPLRSPHEVQEHTLGNDAVQLPGGSGRQSTEGMHFAENGNDEVFGVKPPSTSIPWWMKTGGALTIIGGMAALMSRKKP